jgi:integrase
MPKNYDLQVRPYLTNEEYRRLADGIDVLEDKALIVTGVETGMRVSEITEAGFPIEQINWESGIAMIYDQKKDSWRPITIPAPARTLLRMYLNQEKRTSGPVFCLSYKTANRRLKYWVSKLGIQKYRDGSPVEVSWHCVRHTFVKLSQAAGRDPQAIAQQTGDSLMTILRIYGTWEPGQMSKYFDKVPLIVRDGDPR